jgi:preprotein translocase subunit SecB
MNKPAAKQFDLERIYLKKSSFELIEALKAFAATGAPKIGLDIKNHHTLLPQKHLYEVILDITLKIKMVDKEKNSSQKICLCQIAQAGIFKICGFSDDEVQLMLSGYCLDVLYPYIRQEVSHMLASASLPSILLKPLSFEALYQQSLIEKNDRA